VRAPPARALKQQDFFTIYRFFLLARGDRYKFWIPASRSVGALAALVILGFIGFVAFILGLIALWIYICVYVYRDAKRRGMDATVWLLLVLLTGLIGLIVYLIVRRDHPIQPPPPPPQHY